MGPGAGGEACLGFELSQIGGTQLLQIMRLEGGGRRCLAELSVQSIRGMSMRKAADAGGPAAEGLPRDI